MPPSLLATALLLQTHDKVSDAEAKAKADFDVRWKVALGIELEDRPFAKSTLQVFRAQLILHDKVREAFESSLRLARYFGRVKTKFQLYLAATVANLTLVAAKAGLTGDTGSGAVSAAHRAQRPSFRPLTSSLRGSVKPCPWPCLRRHHCRNSSLRTRLSGQISSQQRGG